MRMAIAGTAIAMAVLIVASGVGVAAAETTPSSSTSSTVPPNTVSVVGVATVPLAQGASATTATAAYRQAMAGAETDAHQKAEFLAEKAGTGIGAVQSIAEAGGEISCTGSEEGGYAEYQGQQPDFGESNASPFERATVAPAAAKPAVKHKHKRRHKKAAAKKARVASGSATASCTLSARVALVYALS